ncbi:LCCL domain-containing protein, putative [Eimeria tenella]|uniref:LCCL domain-containing protein, putative n=1 Tax=Eimeria tenella TaxID=5802 RepID=U6L489_EIMTE|nr:LCCL domain-containing protein, putative [Eimeria tenella]CDJ44018.1 LCCL domain-containing protein, putative [Eimeria tenella]|eukprot:XP_013234767.1 LCCL domain-containing protein, putative [Eimeria tenella]
MRHRDLHIQENNEDLVESMLQEEEDRALRRSLGDLQEAAAADTKAIQDIGRKQQQVPLEDFLILLLQQQCSASSSTPWQSCAAPPGGAQALQQLTEFRKSHRRTVDGRLCAAAFVQDDQTYTDCTAAKAPNGTADKVRVKARQAFEMKAAEAEAMIKRLDGSIYQADLAAKKLEALCGKRHEAAEQQLETARNIFLRNQNCLKRLSAAAAKAQNLKELIKDTRGQVQQQQAAAAQRPENCLRAAGYEEDPPADGLRGAYFDNCCFEGPPRIQKIAKDVNFSFSGSGPLEGLKVHNYSIRKCAAEDFAKFRNCSFCFAGWDGFVQIPETGHYVFTTETDNGARVFLNGQPVVADRMPPGNPAEASGNKRVSLLSAVQKSGKHFSNSHSIRLIRKKKYKIRVEFVHNSHFLVDNSDRGSLRLMWSSEDFPREVIPSKFFFSTDRPPPLKVSSLDPALYALSLLLEGAPAFADTAAFELHAVPPHLKGLRFLRSRRSPSEALMEFHLNSAAALFVAHPQQQPFPLAPFEDYLWKAQDTEDRIFIEKTKDNSQQSSRESAQESPEEKTQEEPKEGPESPEKEPKEGPESPEKEPKEGPESPEKEPEKSPEEHLTLQVKRIVHRGGPVSLSIAHKGVPFLVILAPLEDAAAACAPLRNFLQTLTAKQDLVEFIWMALEAFGSPEVATVQVEITQMFVNGGDSGGSFEFWGVPCLTAAAAADAAPAVLELERGAPLGCMYTRSCMRLPPLPGGPPETVCCCSFQRSCFHGPRPCCSFSGLLPRCMHSLFAAAAAAAEAADTLRSHWGTAPAAGLAPRRRGPKEAPGEVLLWLAERSSGASVQRTAALSLSAQQRGPRAFAYSSSERSSKQIRSKNSLPAAAAAAAAAVQAEAGSATAAAAAAAANFWSLSVPLNGRYLVAAELGNCCGVEGAGGAAAANLEVNGIPLVENLQIQERGFYVASVFVEVKEKIILLTAACEGEKCSKALTTLFNLVVQKL